MEAEDSGDADQNISAYAKLEFDQFSFFIQTLTLVVGRKAKRDDNVDVHLGMSKSISRVHAKIYYQFDAMSWEVEVLGKNGAFVNERYIAAGQICRLNNTDKLQIAEIGFSFLLPEVAAPPTHPTTSPHIQMVASAPVVGAAITPAAVGKVGDLAAPISANTPNLPLAPHHIMQRYTKPPEKSVDIQTSNGTLAASKPSKTAQEVGQTTDKTITTATGKSSGVLPQASSTTSVPSDLTMKKARKKYTKKDQLKAEDSDVPNLDDVWNTAMSCSSRSQSPEMNFGLTTSMGTKDAIDQPVRTAEEQKIFDEETAAQHAAQLLHQERLTRQAMEEEEGLILPPPETNPTVIANLQKPTASYATMIYNAIMSHEKKKMTLAQIYSWICIYHPYYRYIQNGWQNSIRHNLSLNKAFKKVPRTDDEPGKGSFWAVDPDSEMLFEGGVYKKKPPRPAPTTPVSRGAPVVMKDGKLTLNPNYFAGGIQGKAEEVIQMLHTAVQEHIGSAATPEQVSQLARILALALATQLRLSAVNKVQPVTQAARPAAQYYSATPAARVSATGSNVPNRISVPASNSPYSMVPKANGTTIVNAAVRPVYAGNGLMAKPGGAQPTTGAIPQQGAAKTASTPVSTGAHLLASRPTNGVTPQKTPLPLPTSTNPAFKRTEVPQVTTPAKVGQQLPTTPSTIVPRNVGQQFPGTPSTVVPAVLPGHLNSNASSVVSGNPAIKANPIPDKSTTPVPPVSVAKAATAVQQQTSSAQQPSATQPVKTDQSVTSNPPRITTPTSVPNLSQRPVQNSFSVPGPKPATATPSPIVGSRVATGQTILPIPVLVAMGDRKSAGTPPTTLTNKRSLDDNISTEANKIQKGKHDETPSSVQRTVVPAQPQSTESKTAT